MHDDICCCHWICQCKKRVRLTRYICSSQLTPHVFSKLSDILLSFSAWRADSGSANFDPCVDDEVEAYLNRADVQAALHANDSAHALPWAWKDCNPRIKYNQ